MNLKMNKNSREKKLNSGKKKWVFLSELHTTKKVCNEKYLQKSVIFCTKSPICAIFSLYF